MNRTSRAAAAWALAAGFGLSVTCAFLGRAAQTITYTYDAAGRLTSATYDDSLTTTYAYDPSGNLLEIRTESPVSGIPENPFDPTLPSVVSLGRPAPNPITSATTLDYQLPEAADVTFQVFDVSGRRIRSLLTARMPAGYHGIVWDGCDDAGRTVASGTYFLCARLGLYQAARTVSIVR